MPPRIAVQILTYANSQGERDGVRRLRDSLLAMNYPKDAWCIVVVDNPSTQGNLRAYLADEWMTESEQRLPKVFVLPQENNTGFAGGHMIGLAASRAWGAEYVYLLNQDAYVDSEMLARIVAHAEAHPNAAVLQSRVMLAQTPDRLNSCGNALHYLGFSFSIDAGAVYRSEQSLSLPMFCASGAAVLVRMSAIEKIGLFAPEYFLYHEDVDLSWRARLAGYDISVVHDSVVFHHYEFMRSISKVYLMERNRHLTNFVNYEWRTLAILAPMALVMEIGTFFFAVKSGWGREKVRSWLFFVFPSTWRLIARRRAHVRTFRAVKDREIIGNMCTIITNQEIENPLLTHIVNPIMTGYFRLITRLFFR